MTNKCRRRMNGRKGYITTEISQREREEEKERPRERRDAPRMREELRVHILR